MIYIASNPNYPESEKLVDSFITCPPINLEVNWVKDTKSLLNLKGSRIFFVFWNDKIPPSIINNNRCVSFHTAPLPQYRGGNPIQNQMLDGKKETELCAFLTTESMDGGDILCRSPISLTGDIGETLCLIRKEATQQIARILTEDIAPQPQEGTPTFCKRLTEEQKEITRDMAPEHADALVRGFNSEPYSPAYIRLAGGKKLGILKARLIE